MTLLKIIKGLSLFIQGARIKTLPAIWVPISMSSAYAFYQTGVLKKDILFFTLASATFIQIAVNFFNDAMDFKEGLDSSLRKGPQRLSQSGKLSASQTQNLGTGCLLMAIGLSLPLVIEGGLPIVILGLLSCFCVYLYTGGPFSLLKTGLAELFVFLFFGLGAVGGTYYLQTLSLDSRLIYIGFQCGFWAMSLLLINFLRDEEEDRRGGRKHVVTLYGRANALFVFSTAQAFIYLLCFYWLGENIKSGAFCFFLIPLSIILTYLIANTPPSKKYNQYLAICSLIYILFGGVWIGGLFF